MSMLGNPQGGKPIMKGMRRVGTESDGDKGMPAPKEAHGDGGGHGSTTLHDHGDGTFHTEGQDGERTEHPHIGHALVHMGARHAGGAHHHSHDGGDGRIVSHSSRDGGEADGPREHGSPEEAGQDFADSMGGSY